MATALSPEGWLGWLRLLVGCIILLLPGLATAWRIFGDRHGLWFAPVLSFSLLPLIAILLDFAFGVPVNAMATHLIAIVLAVWIGWPMLVDAWKHLTVPGDTSRRQRAAGRHDAADTGAGGNGAAPHHDARPGPADDQDVGAANQASRRRGPLRHVRWGSAWCLLLVVPFVMLVQSLPHVPGDAPEEPLDVVPEMASRGVDWLQGDHDPYPVHVDEYTHAAIQAEIIRQEKVDVGDPYSAQDTQRDDLFTIGGFRSERGADVAMVQFHHLTDLDLGAIARWMPSFWSGFTAIAFWAVLHPARGAVAGAAMVAVLPTTLRFLGPAFLIPSTFALPWIFAAIHIALRADGAPRFFGLLLVLTGAPFIHIVPGVLTILAAAAATLVRPEPWRHRMSMMLAVFVPLLWVVPNLYQEAVDTLATTNVLPLQPEFFSWPGFVFYAFAGAGTAWAFWRPRASNAAHRGFILLAIPIGASLVWSIRNDHANDGTYSRQVFAFLLCLAAPASLAIGEAAHRVARQIPAPRWRPSAAGAVTAGVLFLLLLAPLHADMNQRYYRIHDEDSWQRGEIVDDFVTQDDVFFSEPWQAMWYNAVTGATPHQVFQPGADIPQRGGDYAQYIRSGGADQEWLAVRGITVVVSDVPPNAPHTELGDGVYRLS